MTFTPFGRFVFIAQWVMVVVLPWWIIGGRILLGVELGWMGVVGVFYSPVLLLGLLLPPIVSLFDSEVRSKKSERTSYSYAMLVAWLGVFFAAFALPDATDDGAVPSAFMKWFGIGELTSTNIAWGLLILAGLAAIAAIVFAIKGITKSRQADLG